MRLKIYWPVLLLLLFSFFTLQFSQAVLQDSQTMTNYGSIVPHIGIFFEYGAESEVLQPPLAHAGPNGEGDHSGSNVTIVNTVARSGTKSIMIYEKPPPHSDAQRRVECRTYDTKTEYYMSWHTYFPSNKFTAGVDYTSWKALSGQTLRYYPSGQSRWTYKNSWGFTLLSSGKISIRVDYTWNNGYDEWYTGYTLNSTYLDTWIHFELYTKIANGTAGIHKAWINGNLVKEVTGIATDPRDDLSRWNSESCDWTYGYAGEPFWKIQIYNSQGQPECWYYWDDVVLSDTYVPSSYHVGH